MKWESRLATGYSSPCRKSSLAKKWRKKWQKNQKKWSKSDRKSPKNENSDRTPFADLFLRHPEFRGNSHWCALQWYSKRNGACCMTPRSIVLGFQLHNNHFSGSLPDRLDSWSLRCQSGTSAERSCHETFFVSARLVSQKLRTSSTTTRDRNLQFRAAVSTGGSPLDFLLFLQYLCAI